MLVSDLRTIGSNLLKVRKLKGLTQAEVAEKAELSDRTYADIERGNVTMRVDSLMKICGALQITPDDILTVKSDIHIAEHDFIDIMKDCTISEKETALKLLYVYINSIK